MRAMKYWNDFDTTLALFDNLRRMDRAFDRRPEISFRDDGKALLLVAEVPGIPQENLKVSLHNNTLTISGERKDDAPIKFSRSFKLPAKIDPEKAKAELKDGILRLTLEKAAEAQPREISVQAA